MRIYARQDVAELSPYRDIIEALRQAFRADVTAPARHHHTITRPGTDPLIYLIMPAWTGMGKAGKGGYAGLKTVMVGGSPTVQANYMLYAGDTAETLAIMDGTEITARRTACASALAADYLARPDATKLLMVGAGVLGPHVVRAHATVRKIREVAVYNRSRAKAETLVAELAADGFEASSNPAARDQASSARLSLAPRCWECRAASDRETPARPWPLLAHSPWGHGRNRIPCRALHSPPFPKGPWQV